MKSASYAFHTAGTVCVPWPVSRRNQELLLAAVRGKLTGALGTGGDRRHEFWSVQEHDQVAKAIHDLVTPTLVRVVLGTTQLGSPTAIGVMWMAVCITGVRIARHQQMHREHPASGAA
jgi:hypothetical protein